MDIDINGISESFGGIIGDFCEELSDIDTNVISESFDGIIDEFSEETSDVNIDGIIFFFFRKLPLKVFISIIRTENKYRGSKQA